MKKINFLMAAAFIIAAVVLSMIFLIGCNTPAPEKEESKTAATVVPAAAKPNGGAPMGVTKMVFSGKPVALRMNFSVHFNADKKTDRYSTYYDRSVIVKAMGGRNILDELKTKK